MPANLSIAITGSRQALTSDWYLAATPPALIADPSQLSRIESWLALPALGSVAAALRQLGQWSLDSAPRRFDAEDWWYRLHFNVLEHKSSDTLILGFDGLATLADIWLNGNLLFSSSNMFVGHQHSVGHCLKAEDNELVIVFRAIDQYLTQRRPRPRWRVPMLEHQQLRWIRTTLLGRTPGWSPPAAVVGAWRGIWLEHCSPITLHTLSLKTTAVDNNGLLSIQCGFKRFTADNPIERVSLLLTRKEQQHSVDLLPVSDEHDLLFTAQLRIAHVDRWWPHTHGEPALYQVQLHVKRAGLEMPVTVDLSTVGFRTVQVTRDQAHFSVCINGVPIFCRGACWTPLDPVTLDVSAEQYPPAIAQVREAGMNMLRVSGTMAYETDAFYAACAEQGVMVWQDFMFASMDYPDTPDFYASVQQEVEQQLTRWQYCPALTVLCGNSEVEQQAAMWGAPREYWSPPLFHDVLADLAKKYIPDVPYWPSSAHDGAFPHQNNVGTTSYYGVGAYLQPLEDARRSQVTFATECLAFANVPEGFNVQKIPSPSSLIKVHHPRWKERVPRDLGAGWDFEDVRDHYLTQCFGVEALTLRYADHERYLLLSRVTSGELMAAAFNEWRSSYSPCQGGLIWFLRDLWPGAGWGILDSDGHPKAAYYYLKRALQPLSLSISDEGTNGLVAHIIHEGADPLSVKLDITVYKSGQIIANAANQTLKLKPRSVFAHPLLNGFDHFMDLSYAYRFGPPLADAIHVQLHTADAQIIREAFYFPLGLTHMPLVELGLQASVTFLENGDAAVTVQCHRLALAVYFDIAGFIPEEAYFHLAPNRPKTITMRCIKPNSRAVFGYLGAINTPEMITIKTVP
ncbi:MAG: hypothetical protein QX197_16005 [Methylococcaceae bacterium]